jgi:hypothetical protein
MAGSTGQGTTVAFTTAGAISCVRSITLPEWSMETIDAACLNDVGFAKKIAGDLVDAGTVELTVVFELTDAPYTPDGVQDTITVTFPSAGATGGVLTGTGYITSCTLPSVEINGLLEQTIVFTFDAETGPTWTAGTAS